VLVPLDSSGLSMGRTRKGEIRIRTYTRYIVGNRSPSPEQRAAKVLGFPPTVILKYDVIQLYSDLEREYECRPKCPLSPPPPCRMSRAWGPTEMWIRSQAQLRYNYGNSILSKYLHYGTDCDLPCSGRPKVCNAFGLYDKKEIEGYEKDKILKCLTFEFNFNTVELLNLYEISLYYACIFGGHLDC
jgi:hypothetical protein